VPGYCPENLSTVGAISRSASEIRVQTDLSLHEGYTGQFTMPTGKKPGNRGRSAWQLRGSCQAPGISVDCRIVDLVFTSVGTYLDQVPVPSRDCPSAAGRHGTEILCSVTGVFYVNRLSGSDSALNRVQAHGVTSMTKETVPILGRLCGTTSVISHRLNEIILESIKLHIVEMEDVLFHLDSAVMMPENPEAENADDDGTDLSGAIAESGQQNVTGIEALAIVFKELEFDPERIVLVASHADTSGSYEHNFTLTDLRGENVSCLLTGNRERWAEISASRHNIEDYQQILAYAAKKKNRPDYDPKGIDDAWGPDTRAACEAFFTTVCPTGATGIIDAIQNSAKKKWPIEAWRYVYDLYDEVLRTRLDLSAVRMERKRQYLRSRVALLPQGWVACGEMWPIEEAQKNNYRSKENRRAEILLFDARDQFNAASMNQCIVKEKKNSPDEYRKRCPIWPFRQRMVPVYIDKLDIDSYVYHLRFVYSDRIEKKNISVPDGLVIRCFEVPKEAPQQPVELKTEQVYRDGVYYVKVVYTRICRTDNAPGDFYFCYEAHDTYVYRENTASAPVLAVKTAQELSAMSDVERGHYHQIYQEWSSLNVQTFDAYPAEYTGQFRNGDIFLKVVRDKARLRPFGVEITESTKPLSFVVDMLMDDTPGIIIYPSLGCPAFCLKDGKLTIIVKGVDHRLTDQVTRSRVPTPAKVNMHLKVVSWKGMDAEGSVMSIAAIKKALLLNRDIPAALGNPLFPTTALAEQNITVTPLITSPGNGVFDADEVIFALDDASHMRFREYDDVTYGTFYKISITNLPLSDPSATCYNLFWLNRNSDGAIQEIEDVILQEQLKSNTLPIYLPQLLSDDSLQCGFRVFATPGKTNQGDIDLCEKDPELPVCSYHVLYCNSQKTFLNFAHYGDLHLSSRNNILKRSRARVIEFDGQEHVGDLLNDNFETVYNLIMKALDDDAIDMLLIAGDIIDFIHSFFPKRFLDHKNTDSSLQYDTFYRRPDAIWDDVGVAYTRDNTNENYLDGVDFYAFYSLLATLLMKKAKPVVIVPGNHDCYYWPWGLSPRVRLPMNPDGAYVMMANEGIPADQNLTVYEAILAYGPRYESIGGRGNFQPQRFNLFHTLLNPFRNFSLVTSAWTLTGLHWENEEDLLLDDQGLGHLPRADRPINTQQMTIIDTTLARGKSRNLLLSHFTFVSYREPLSNCDEQNPTGGRTGDVHYDSVPLWGNVYDDCCMGTFEEQRVKMYKELIWEQKKYDFIMSGHSHRRGLYQVVRDDESFRNSLTVRLWDYDQFAQCPGPKIVVCDSAGTLPRFNWNGEFGGWGSDYPSFAKVSLTGDGSCQSFEAVPTDNEKAKPRFAVAVDYNYIMHGNNFFDEFESVPRMGVDALYQQTSLRFNLVLENWCTFLDITDIALFTYYGNAFHRAPGTAHKGGGSTIEVRFDFTDGGRNNAHAFLTNAATAQRRTFLSVGFAPLSGKGWGHYNYDSALTMEIEFRENWLLSNHYFEILRPPRIITIFQANAEAPNAEVPDFTWRRNEVFNLIT
jgi:hypothetical protein